MARAIDSIYSAHAPRAGRRWADFVHGALLYPTDVALSLFFEFSGSFDVVSFKQCRRFLGKLIHWLQIGLRSFPRKQVSPSAHTDTRDSPTLEAPRGFSEVTAGSK